MSHISGLWNEGFIAGFAITGKRDFKVTVPGPSLAIPGYLMKSLPIPYFRDGP